MTSKSPNAKIIEVDQVMFNDLISQKQRLALVDFGAPWCPPCIALIPTLEELNETFEDQVVIVSVNVDKEPTLAQNFSIKSLPTVILFKNGEIFEKFYGRQQFQTYSQSLLRALKGI